MDPTAPATGPSPVMLIAEIGGALLGGFILAVAFYFGLGLLLVGTPWGQQLGMGVLTLQVYAGILGFGIGAGGGTALAGRLLGQRGSVWLAMLAAMLGGALIAVVMRVFTPGGLFWTLGIAIIVAAVSAVVGYNLRRQ